MPVSSLNRVKNAIQIQVRSFPGKKTYMILLKRMLVFLIAFFPISILAGACDLLPHEWVIAAKKGSVSSLVSYALADGMFQCRRQLETEFSNTGKAPGKILFAGCFDGRIAPITAGPERSALEEAIETAWPASQAGFLWQPGLSLDDHEGLVRAARSVQASYTAFIQVKDPETEEIDLVDGVFFLWACVRLVLKEKAKIFVKILDQQGQTVFLDEFEVSPTVLSEVIMTPLGCFLQRMEKRNSRPVAMFFESVEPGVHGLFLQDQFAPESGIPPANGRELPLPGVDMTPQSPVIFLENASGTPQ